MRLFYLDNKFRTTAVMKVETDIIASVTVSVSPVKYVETFKLTLLFLSVTSQCVVIQFNSLNVEKLVQCQCVCLTFSGFICCSGTKQFTCSSGWFTIWGPDFTDKWSECCWMEHRQSTWIPEKSKRRQNCVCFKR